MNARTDSSTRTVGPVISIVGVCNVEVGCCREGMIEKALGHELFGFLPARGVVVDPPVDVSERSSKTDISTHHQLITTTVSFGMNIPLYQSSSVV